ncbi:unnamed protein product [Bemisia tabaci]|uniref:Uncharacterized protein n=1 Tax=Bemisia tabaci TaxID=7038 RepID=A0A9P0A1Y4_BEMTA|nr:unnamed protein product [Bemisia tabaci]
MSAGFIDSHTSYAYVNDSSQLYGKKSYGNDLDYGTGNGSDRYHVTFNSGTGTGTARRKPSGKYTAVGDGYSSGDGYYGSVSMAPDEDLYSRKGTLAPL